MTKKNGFFKEFESYDHGFSLRLMWYPQEEVPGTNLISTPIQERLFTSFSHGNSNRTGKCVFFFNSTTTSPPLTLTVAPLSKKFLNIVEAVQFSKPDSPEDKCR